jgi:hypothetical protein
MPLFRFIHTVLTNSGRNQIKVLLEEPLIIERQLRGRFEQLNGAKADPLNEVFRRLPRISLRSSDPPGALTNQLNSSIG